MFKNYELKKSDSTGNVFEDDWIRYKAVKIGSIKPEYGYTLKIPCKVNPSDNVNILTHIDGFLGINVRNGYFEINSAFQKSYIEIRYEIHTL